jgi:hypothetical protein
VVVAASGGVGIRILIVRFWLYIGGYSVFGIQPGSQIYQFAPLAAKGKGF